MSAGNNVTVVGNVTRDPELKFLNSGSAVCSFGLAVNRRWQNRQTDEWEEAVSFFDVTCWQQLAENVSESVGKGTRVVVDGRLEQETWENPDGEKRSKVKIVADEVGVSLRWATVPEVVKNERDGDGGQQQRQPSSRGSSRRQPSGGGGRQSGGDFGDGEPF